MTKKSEETSIPFDTNSRNIIAQLQHCLAWAPSTGFDQNGDRILLFQCRKCLMQARTEDGKVLGCLIEYYCDAKAEDKTMEFVHADLSPEFRAELDKPWRAPSEKS